MYSYVLHDVQHTRDYVSVFVNLGDHLVSRTFIVVVCTESRIAALEMAAASRPSDLLQAERRFGDELQRQQLTAQAKQTELEAQQTH
jgi:hypothetical protein